MRRLVLAAMLASAGFATAADAATVWTNWTSGTTGNVSGSAAGTLGGVSVSYTGEMQCLNCFASNWSPASTWTGGPVDSAPPGNSGIQLFGSFGATDTITFSSPITNPVLAIVSLGQAGITTSFDFTPAEPFVLHGGGPSSTWGGVALTSLGNNVLGTEGNGPVMLVGTYSSITWTNPVYENYYAVTVGSVVPEPATWAMMLLGFVGLGFAARRSARRTASVA